MAKSNTFLLIIITTVLVASLAVFAEGFTNELEYVRSAHDNRQYLVRNLQDKDKAAVLLSVIRERLLKLIKHLQKKYPNTAKIERLARNFNSEKISENVPDSKYTSYSVNKGEKVVFCVRQRNDQNELMDLNTMMFVAIHELSHMMTLSIGHDDPVFWENMKFLLGEAIEIGLYKYQAFHDQPKAYCGTMITDTPLKNVDDPPDKVPKEVVIEERVVDSVSP